VANSFYASDTSISTFELIPYGCSMSDTLFSTFELMSCGCSVSDTSLSTFELISCGYSVKSKVVGNWRYPILFINIILLTPRMALHMIPRQSSYYVYCRVIFGILYNA